MTQSNHYIFYIMTSRSVFGKEYPTDLIQSKDDIHHKILRKLRNKPENKFCADCGDSPTSWTSITLGVFLCTRCAQIHRGIGTHISKIKSSMGTYTWYPDEIEAMKNFGNKVVNEIYYGRVADELIVKPNKDTDNDEVKEFIKNKYDKKLWM